MLSMRIAYSAPRRPTPRGPLGRGRAMGQPRDTCAANARTEHDILFMVRAACKICGHTLLFDSESFFDGNTPTLENG